MASVGAISRTAFGETPESPPPLGEPSRDVATRDPISRATQLPPLPAEYVTEEASFWRVGYHPSARERIRSVMPRLSEMRDELRVALGTDVLEDVEIRIAALDAAMVRLTPREVSPPPTGAVFFEQHLVVVSSAARPGADPQSLETAIRYQMARLALSEAVNRNNSSARGGVSTEGHAENAGAGGAANAPIQRPHRTIPSWFEDAFATHFAREREATRAEALFLAAARGSLPHVSELGLGLGREDEENAYAADFVRFVSETNEGAALPAVVEKVNGGSELDEAIAMALGSDRAGVDRAWRRDMAKRYGLFPVLALSLVLWLALWVVGLVRRRRAIAASESTVSRLRALRRSRVLDADGVITITTRPSKREAAASPHLVEGARQHDAVYADRPAAGVAGDAPTRRRDGAPPPKVIEVPTIEHDGDRHTLH